MKSELTITVIGADGPGTFESLVKAPQELGAEVLSSKVMRLAGQMSALLHVAVQEGRATDLEQRMNERFPGLKLFFTSLDPSVEQQHESKIIKLGYDCRNRPGAEQELDAILERLGVQVENMESRRCRVANIGETLFSAICTLRIPASMSGQAVADEIEAVADEARVNLM